MKLIKMDFVTAIRLNSKSFVLLFRVIKWKQSWNNLKVDQTSFKETKNWWFFLLWKIPHYSDYKCLVFSKLMTLTNYSGIDFKFILFETHDSFEKLTMDWWSQVKIKFAFTSGSYQKDFNSINFKSLLWQILEIIY